MEELPLQQIHPGHLHSNSTSHPWAFSAVAELIDNAQDPDVAASEMWIDKEVISSKVCLVLVDNGYGMDLDNLTKMLSFGYCDKKSTEEKFKPSERPIGQYGNGFKSGSMRLANDALVLTVCQDRQAACVGLLSQTMCNERNLDKVVIPMIKYTLPDLVPSKEQSVGTFQQSLVAILEFSPYHKEEDLKAEFQKLIQQKPPRSLKQRGQKGGGTKIVLFKLKMNKGMLELDFVSDDQDIRNPETLDDAEGLGQQRTKVFEYKQSLRRYCSILYQKPKLIIYIRKKKVTTCFLKSTLLKPRSYNYKPKGKPDCEITFGRPSKESTVEDYGVMFYHRNRLITPYKKLGCQLKLSDKGVNVLGVVDVSDVLQPTHIKQEFVDTPAYRTAIQQFSRRLDDYCGLAEKLDPSKGEEDNPWIWVQCDKCLKWRRLPQFAEREKKVKTKKWFCKNNPDTSKNRCEIPEEVLGEEEFDLSGDTSKSEVPESAKATSRGQTGSENPSKDVAAGSGFGKNSLKSPDKRRNVFTVAMDNAMLLEIIKENPYKDSDSSAWSTITANLIKSGDQFRNLEIKMVMDRATRLLQLYQKGEPIRNRKKATPEENAETESLLEQIEDLFANTEHAVDPAKKRNKSISRVPSRDRDSAADVSNVSQDGTARMEDAHSDLKRKLSYLDEPVKEPTPPEVAPKETGAAVPGLDCDVNGRRPENVQVGLIQAAMKLASPFLPKRFTSAFTPGPPSATLAAPLPRGQTSAFTPVLSSATLDLDSVRSTKKRRMSKPTANKKNPVCSRWWQFRDNFTSEGGTLYGVNSDVCLTVPEEAINASETVQIRGAISTDLEKAYKMLLNPKKTQDREVIVSPIAEYTAYPRDSFDFQQPVVISLPHFLPPGFDPDKVKVYRFCREDNSHLRCHRMFRASPEGGEDCASRRVKIKKEPGYEDDECGPSGGEGGRAKGPGPQNVRAGFYFDEDTADKEVQIRTYRFSGYFCTYETPQAEPSHISMRLYARRGARETFSSDVDVLLMMWDLRLNIRDFREVALPTGGMIYQNTTTLEPVSGLDLSQVTLGLVFHSPSWSWTHRLDEDKQPLFPARKRIPLQMFSRCVCGTEPVRVHWSLRSSGRMTQFEGFVSAGYVMKSDVNFQLMEHQPKERMPIWIDWSASDPQNAGPLPPVLAPTGYKRDPAACVFHRDGGQDNQ